MDQDAQITMAFFKLRQSGIRGSAPGQQCFGKYPPGAKGKGKIGGNTFVVVPVVEGACSKPLNDKVAAAMPVLNGVKQPLSGVIPLSCGYKLNMDSGGYTPEGTRMI